jgi:D-amino peptidase
MKFMIGVDCDGAACVVGEPGRALSDSCDYAFSRGQATREADAAARALFECGAEKVVIWDNHGSGANLDYHLMDARCDFAIGSGFGRRWPGLDSGYAGVLMIGYHAMQGTPGGVLAHTCSSSAYRWIKMGGREVGEIALDAAVAGEFGVPLILVASDECGCEEARRFVPWVQTVATKRGVGRNAAFSPSPARVQDNISAGVAAAVGQLKEMRTFAFAQPLDMELCYKSMLHAMRTRLRLKGWRLSGLHTRSRTLASMKEWSC